MYFVAAKHVIVKYGLCYLKSMQHLHESILKRCLKGQNGMHRNMSLWNIIWSGMYIETKFMRHKHGSGNIVGVTHKMSIVADELSVFISAAALK